MHVFGPIQSDEAFCHFRYVVTSLCSAIFLLSYCAGYCSHLVILVQLRSSSSGLLLVPKLYTSIGTRAFAVGAPTLWNMLPSSVKSVANIAKFRRYLKTSLYNLAYPPKCPGVSISQSDDNWICLLTFRWINHFVLMSL